MNKLREVNFHLTWPCETKAERSHSYVNCSTELNFTVYRYFMNEDHCVSFFSAIKYFLIYQFDV